MGRGDLERLSKEELIELVLRLQRPEKTSRTSSKPPSTDRKEQREHSKPGGAKPGHEGHSRVMSATPDEVVEHRPDRCSGCGAALTADLPAETVSVHEQIELPEVKPLVTHHRRLAVRCPACGTRVVAPVPEAAAGHAVRAARACHGDLSQDLPGSVLRAAAGRIRRPVRAAPQPGRPDEPAAARAGRLRGRADKAVAALRQAKIIASDETGVRIEGSNAYHWVFRCPRRWSITPRRPGRASWSGP